MICVENLIIKMKVHFLFLFFYLNITFGYGQKHTPSITSKLPNMQETADWLNDIYKKLKPDSLISRQTSFMDGNYQFDIPIDFKIEGKYLYITHRPGNNYFDGHRWSSNPDIVENEIIDLSTIDTIRIRRDRHIPSDSYYNDYNENFFELKTKGGLETIKYTSSGLRENGYTFHAEIVIIRQGESDIRNRFIKALKYYCQLCRQKYPIKKQLF